MSAKDSKECAALVTKHIKRRPAFQIKEPKPNIQISSLEASPSSLMVIVIHKEIQSRHREFTSMLW